MRAFLERAVEDGTPQGSYLILGKSETLVKREANDFLRKIFCDSHTGCGACPGCAKFDARSHPDLLVVGGVKVADAQLAPPFLARRPFENAFKGVLIERVDLMTPQAQNALLKSVEEPPEDTVMVLCAVNEKAVLPTILSRCIRVQAEPDSDNALARLTAATKLPEEKANILLQIRDGDFGGARQLFEEGYFEAREKAAEAVARLLTARNKATSRVEGLLMNGGDNPVPGLEAALIYLSDVMSARYMGNEASLVNADMRRQIVRDSAASARRLVAVSEGLHGLLERLGATTALNKRLALQGALLNILEDIV